ncbi:MAG TPA: glutamate--tRNA ligase family protein [Vicinamibacterales bacterium]|nr:glutamate--tRNA ligase family protein [Vicinamibacterales bacterium]
MESSGATPLVTRFAPAPTGFLHLGHIVNAIYVWGVARAGAPGRVVLRIEDHDRFRSRLEFESAILEDLEWLGFVPDGQPVRQRERNQLYDEALESLRRRGLTYACRCTRSQISADRVSGAQAFDPGRASDEPRYPGTCARKGLTEGPGVGLRVRLEPSVERFEDWRHGWQEQRPDQQCGDMLVRDRDGNWTYQFAATVDDWLQHVTLVVRGDDLLASTGRQIQLARLLGRPTPPAFLHHPLVMKGATQKLSKSDGDTGIRDLRARGWSAAEVIGQAAALAHLIDAPRPLDVGAIAQLFAGLRPHI